jgi:nicotinamide mononucleotide transporter
LFTPIEAVSTFFAAAYVVLATRQSIWCWPSGLIAVVLMFIVLLESRLYPSALLQIYFFAMSIYGWYEWQRGGEQHQGVRVHWLPVSRHLLLAAAMVSCAIVSGAFWSGTEAVNPYLDSLAMVGSIVATFMVARKIIENWIYWLVTDSVYIYLYLSNELLWYAGLSVFYMIMASIGLRAWIIDWRRHRDVALVA